MFKIFLFFTAMAASAVAGETRPNIVLIYADDLGFGDVSVNGGQIATPTIDRLASEGLRFTDAHSSAATCTPSRFSLLTGRYAFRQKGTGILPGDARLIIGPDEVTLPKLLRGAGYRTGVVGKWHLGLGNGSVDWNAEIKPGPDQVGFDYHFLIPATGDRVPCVYVEQNRVVGGAADDPISVSYGKRIDPRPSGRERPDLLKQRWSHGHDQTIVNGISRIGWMVGGKQAEWVDEDMADVITRKAVGFIEASAAKQEPFFLFFATQDIHVPRVPHSRFAGKSGRGPRGDAILQLDWCVGELLAALDKLQLAENTLVIFASDNGPVLDDGYVDEANELLTGHQANGPYRAGKYSLYEGATRTPLVVRWPQRIKPGQTSEALVGQIDFAASLAGLVGAEVPAGACGDSRDELDTLLGEDAVGRPHLVHEASRLALREGNWKFIPPGKVRDSLNPGPLGAIKKPGALYDLETDPGETRNLAENQPERLQAMRTKLESIATSKDSGR